MSELTKIAAIFAKHLSDAFLSIHHELTKLENPPLSQPKESVSIIETMQRPQPLKLNSYHSPQKILVQVKNSNFPLKMRILRRLSDTEYLAYPQGQLKSLATKITYEQIIGVDPDP